MYKWNHDSKYNESLPYDSIVHIYADKFEQFEDDDYLQEFLSRHGRKWCMLLTLFTLFVALTNEFYFPSIAI